MLVVTNYHMAADSLPRITFWYNAWYLLTQAALIPCTHALMFDRCDRCAMHQPTTAAPNHAQMMPTRVGDWGSLEDACATPVAFYSECTQGLSEETGKEVGGTGRYQNPLRLSIRCRRKRPVLSVVRLSVWRGFAPRQIRRGSSCDPTTD